jgi:hypothetical protein
VAGAGAERNLTAIGRQREAKDVVEVVGSQGVEARTVGVDDGESLPVAEEVDSSPAARPFRLYSAATVFVTLAFGVWSGTYGADIADDLETPGVGVIERISVYAYQVWIGVFAIAVLALAYGRRPARGSRGRSS